MIGKTLGHYKIINQLGRGGMGEVYLAEDLSLDRKVALKFLPEAFTSDPERMARFEREAKLLASLNHPNIAAIYGLEQAEGKRFLIMEYVEGETLQARISKGALPLEEALGVCRQIAEGLEAAHEKGVIHRDLKPANVMITGEEKVKVLDFGLAKALLDEGQSVDSSQSPTITEAMTQPGVVLGTAAYMSPEQAKGKAVDKRADIWAFGCILYECLTGKKAFGGETVTETLASVIKEEPDIEKAPAKVRLLLRYCLAKDRKNRLRDIGDAMTLLKSTPHTLFEDSPAKHSWRWKIIAAVLLITTLSLAFMHFRQEPPPIAKLMRFQIELPDEMIISPAGGFSLSPDGHKLAIAALDTNGNQLIWLYPLDSRQAQPLSGTESTDSVPFFWSPDSRFIAFSANGKLKKVDVSSGAIASICEIPGISVGGGWNSDGVILYTDYNASYGIMKVSSAGGDALPLTRPNKDRQDEKHTLPVFLPDNRHFIYFCKSAIPENTGMYVGSLDLKPEEQKIKQILETSTAAKYLPPSGSIPGQLLFVRDHTLMSQPFDAGKLEKIGEPVSVISNVGTYLEGGFFTVSGPDILMSMSGSGFPRSQLTWIDRNGQNHDLVGQLVNYNGCAISPDGEHVAASIGKASSDFIDIWILDLLRGNQRRIAYGSGNSYFPVWSPDSTHVIFGARRETFVNLYQKAISGIEQEQLLYESGNNKMPTSCSKDGRYVLYTVDKGTTRNDLYLYSYESGEVMPISNEECDEGDGQFDPKMRWIAYVSNNTGSYEVYVRPFSADLDSTSTSKGGITMVSKGGGVQPRWSKDSKELFYRTLDGKVMAVAVEDDEIFQVKETTVLFQGNYATSTMTSFPLSSWDVSEDGNLLLMPVLPDHGHAERLNVTLNWTSLLKK